MTVRGIAIFEIKHFERRSECQVYILNGSIKIHDSVITVFEDSYRRFRIFTFF